MTAVSGASAQDLTTTAERLAERILGGDRAAEASLVTTYGRSVELLLRRHTRSDAEREDLYQETFRIAIEKLRAGDLRQPSRLPGFLAAIARNLAIEHYRKLARRRTDAASDSRDSQMLHQVPSAGTGPLTSLLRSERAELARRAIASLDSERDRQVLLRYYIAEEERESLCADLGLDGIQLSKVLHRARRRFHRLVVQRLDSAAAGALSALVWLLVGGTPTAFPAGRRATG